MDFRFVYRHAAARMHTVILMMVVVVAVFVSTGM